MQAATPTTRAAIRAEIAHIVRHPGGLLLSVASSAAIVLFLWYVVPRSWFFTFTGPEGLPYALAGWMYTDAFVTNVLTVTPTVLSQRSTIPPNSPHCCARRSWPSG